MDIDELREYLTELLGEEGITVPEAVDKIIETLQTNELQVCS